MTSCVLLQANLKNAGFFNSFMFKKLIDELEGIIDSDQKTTHQEIREKVEEILADDVAMRKFAEGFSSLDPALCEFGLPILVQSGGEYDADIYAQPSAKPLSYDSIVLSICTSYRDMNAYASRTLIISPSLVSISLRGCSIGGERELLDAT